MYRTCPIFVKFSHVGWRCIGAIESNDPNEVYRKAKEVVYNGEEPAGSKDISIDRYEGYRVQKWSVPELDNVEEEEDDQEEGQ